MKARSQETFARRWVGVVEIKTGDSTARLTSVDTFGKDTKPKNFPDGSTSIKIKLSEFPAAAKRVIKANMDSKRFRVRLNEDADAVETVTPVSGVFRAKLIGLGPKTKDGEYKLIKKTFNEGTEKENSHLEFLALYEIVEGAFRGVELPGYYLHYKFEEDDEEEGFTRFNTADTPQASQLHKLMAWAETHGNGQESILEAPVRWYDVDDGTILPQLEERALDNDREVNLVFERGYIKSVQPIEDYEEVAVEDEDESDAVDEMLDGDDEKVEPVRVGKATKSDTKVKKAPAKKAKAPVSDDDDL